MALIRSKQLNKELTGDFVLSGSLTVVGQSIFIQTSSIPAIIVSGSQHVVASDSGYSGSIFIQGLGTFADTGSNAVIDLGDESF
jgi:hypothetical protein